MVKDGGKKRIHRKNKRITLVVIRYSNDSIKMSKPCKYCIEYMKKLNIRKIYYSDEDGNMIKEKISKISTNHVSSSTKLLK